MILCQKRIRISTARHRVSATAFTPVKFLSQNLQVKPIPPPLARRCIDRTYHGCRPGLVIDDHGQRGIRHRQKVEALWQCGVPVFFASGRPIESAAIFLVQLGICGFLRTRRDAIGKTRRSARLAAFDG
jgi:hypothetical protein